MGLATPPTLPHPTATMEEADGEREMTVLTTILATAQTVVTPRAPRGSVEGAEKGSTKSSSAHRKVVERVIQELSTCIDTN